MKPWERPSWPAGWTLGTHYMLTQMEWFGPKGSPMSRDEMQEQIQRNRGNFKLIKPVAPPKHFSGQKFGEYWKRITFIDQLSPARGFFLCFSVALNVATAHQGLLNYGQIGLEPAIQYEVAQFSHLAQKTKPIESTERRLEKSDGLKHYTVADYKNWFKTVNKILGDGGNPIIGFNAHFPWLGAGLRQFGHWITILEINEEQALIGGQLSVFDIHSAFAIVDTPSLFKINQEYCLGQNSMARQDITNDQVSENLKAFYAKKYYRDIFRHSVRPEDVALLT